MIRIIPAVLQGSSRQQSSERHLAHGPRPEPIAALPLPLVRMCIMQPGRADRIRIIFDEVARGTDLNRSLSLIADQVAADLGAPACKIWVVKRGDICERCPLAGICSNRQMCMHLAAASGASIDKEYPRIPLSVFNAAIIARGGTSDFSEPNSAGDKLFGLQHRALNEGNDWYALYPLRGTSGILGLIGIFNHRPIGLPELQALSQFAPAAVAVIRVAELRSRCDALGARLEKQNTAAVNFKNQISERDKEVQSVAGALNEKISQLQLQVAETEAERDFYKHESGEMGRRADRLESDYLELRGRVEALMALQQQSGRRYSEMVAQLESERRQAEEENSSLKGRLASIERLYKEANTVRNEMLEELSQRDQSLENLKSEIAARKSELSSATEAVPALEKRVAFLEEANSALRDQAGALSESMDDLEKSLRIAEDARARLEQIRVGLEERVATLSDETSRLRLANSRIADKNEQLVAQVERLQSETTTATTSIVDIEELARLSRLNDELTQANDSAGARIGELEREKRSLLDANEQLSEAVSKYESLSSRLEEAAVKLRDRAEASDRARSELEQRNRVLAEQNRRLRLESHTQARFLANMSHELRTPMNAIIGFTSLLLEDSALQMADRHRANLERVSRNARDLLQLINNVLDLSRIEAGRMDVYSEVADVRDLIERAVSVVEPMKAGRSIELKVEIQEGVPAIHTDRTKLQQILMNLLSNALKFTSEGEIKVTAEPAGANFVRLSVIDSGAGIPESDIPRIFEEFYQSGSVRTPSAGSGLGLAITRRLVQLLGGEITVSSSVGVGAVFNVTLPVFIEGRAASAPEDEVLLSDPKRTALVVDGNPASLYLMKKYLNEAGYSVAATDDPLRALEIARLARPALITVDADISDRALRLIEDLIVETRRRPGDLHQKSTVIAISSDPSIEKRAIDVGVALFLKKPVERADLNRAIARVSAPESKRVLVVDDDPDALDLVVAMLDGNGYDIETAKTGPDAIEEVNRSKPDAMILDIMLPEMDGFEVVHRLSLNPNLASIPVIMMTARDLSRDEREALDSGTVRFIQKGNFSRDELLAEVKRLMNPGIEQVAPTLSDRLV